VVEEQRDDTTGLRLINDFLDLHPGGMPEEARERVPLGV
jgi:hypothetical protein